MTIVIDELKVLLALNGNKRIENLEAEIFANEELTRVYLLNLCKDNPFLPDEKYRNFYSNNSYLVYIYVRDVLRTAWPEAETVIKCSMWAENYAEIMARYKHSS